MKTKLGTVDMKRLFMQKTVAIGKNLITCEEGREIRTGSRLKLRPMLMTTLSLSYQIM